ncbi:MAG: DCC1-like thiol-disulfide oxidoreductase family protein [Pseudomonadota bacterium]
MILDHPPYSYRDDPSIPAFEAHVCVTVMDAHCALCAKGARWIAHNDRDAAFRIIPLQSERGQALMRHYGLNPDDPTSWLLIEEGRAYSSLEAVIRTGRRLGGVWRGLSALSVLPRALQDTLYGAVARNRYRVFGRADLCNLPDPDVEKKLLL